MKVTLSSSKSKYSFINIRTHINWTIIADNVLFLNREISFHLIIIEIWSNEESIILPPHNTHKTEPCHIFTSFLKKLNLKKTKLIFSVTKFVNKTQAIKG